MTLQYELIPQPVISRWLFEAAVYTLGPRDKPYIFPKGSFESDCHLKTVPVNEKLFPLALKNNWIRGKV